MVDIESEHTKRNIYLYIYDRKEEHLLQGFNLYECPYVIE